MEVFDSRQGKKKSQVKYSTVVVFSGVVFLILLLVMLKIQQLLG
jgi:hypothetical protein